MNHDEILIIGAGPSGLTLSYALPDRTRVLEREPEVGGLSRSIELAGAVFDIGGHSFHTPYRDVLDLVRDVMDGSWHTQQRDARVHFAGQLIQYPFQQHFRQLADRAVVEDCLAHQPDPRAAEDARDFEDWIVRRFGPGIANHFMLPYNRKLWARDLRRIGCDWVHERVAGGEKDRGPAADAGRKPLQSNTEIGYPAEGGFGEIFKALARKCGPIELGRAVTRIDADRRTVETQDGEVWAWDRLVSTMPLPIFLSKLTNCPPALIADANTLEYVSLKIVFLVVAKPVGSEPQRVYVADADVPAHKIAFNHTSSASLRQRATQSIICEVSYSSEKPIAPDGAITRAMVDWLVKSSLVGSPEDIIDSRVFDLRYGYPVYTHHRTATVERIRSYLAGLNIHTIGRFGGWSYVNSDACIHEALRLADEMRATG